MARVKNINIIKGTDREFFLVAVIKETEVPKDLSAFVGEAGDTLTLQLPGDPTNLTLSLTENANKSKIEVPDESHGKAGKIKVVLSDIDTALLKVGAAQSMELVIKEGAGPDYDISKVQFLGALTVKEVAFPA